MQTLTEWTDKLENTVYDLCFNPTGDQLIVASGNRVLVYECSTGQLIQPLRGHKDLVYCVCYSKDGSKFASGSADRTVIIWTFKLEGILKYTHGDALQCLAYNPVSGMLASCAASDFGFWTGEQKSVQKYKAHGRITCASWTPDGVYLAIGLASGVVSIRTKNGEEKGRIDRPNGSQTPIWSLAWSPKREEGADVLCIADWGRALSFYTLGGNLIGKERSLNYDPLRVSYTQDGNYLVVGGSGRICEFYTNHGIRLGQLGDSFKSWLWSVATSNTGEHVVVGCQDGSVSLLRINLNVVHSIYKDRYAVRELMTDVIIQNLVSDHRVRIKCRDLILQIAVYSTRLAVQLPERIVIYEVAAQDEMHYKVKAKIALAGKCVLLGVVTDFVIIGQHKTIQTIDFEGKPHREWSFDSFVISFRNLGGMSRRELILIGTENGSIYRIQLDNPTVRLLARLSSSIKGIDIDMTRTRMAVIDASEILHLFELNNGNSQAQLLTQETSATSVAYNGTCARLLVFSSDNGLLNIKADRLPPVRHNIKGTVIGLYGSKLFYMDKQNLLSTELPLSAVLQQYIEQKQFKEALEVARLGASSEEWEDLGANALTALELTVAQRAYEKTRSWRHLEFIAHLQQVQQREQLLQAEVAVFQGRFKDAARYFVKAGHGDRALAMFTDLRMFDAAQEYLGNGDGGEDRRGLLKKKADWATKIKEPKMAADLYVAAGEVDKAIDILTENGWTDALGELGRKLDASNRESLLRVGMSLEKLKAPLHVAAELFGRAGAHDRALGLYIAARKWQDAFALVRVHAELGPQLALAHAQWLAETDQFVLAQKAFHEAGHPEEAYKVLQCLTENAILECRFHDAAYYFWLLGQQSLQLADGDALKKYFLHDRLASIYYAYDAIHRYIEEPFTPYMPEALFNISRFLLLETRDLMPSGISLFAILYTLSKQASSLGAHKLARQTLDRVQSLRVPVRLKSHVDVATLQIRARGFSDAEELLPICYRCSASVPLLPPGNHDGNFCPACGLRFIHSFVTFEVLPLVEFRPADGISDDEAEILLNSEPEETTDHQNNFSTHSLQDVDPFQSRPLQLEPFVTVDRRNLQNLDAVSVLIGRRKHPLRNLYFRNALPDLPIVLCPSCFRAFHSDDFELQLLQKGYCPFCREPNANNNNV